MAQFCEGNVVTYEAGAVMGQFLRVTRTAGVLQLAGVGERGIGMLEDPVFAIGDSVGVRQWNAKGTLRVVAAGAINDDAFVYAAAGGKVASVGIVLLGKAVQAAAGNNSVLEIVPLQDGPAGVSAIAATGTTAANAALLTGRFNTISAADGNKGVILQDLPIGSSQAVYNEHATNGLKVYPPTGGDINDATTDAAVVIEGKTTIQLTRLDATTWCALNFTVNS